MYMDLCDNSIFCKPVGPSEHTKSKFHKHEKNGAVCDRTGMYNVVEKYAYHQT